MINFITAHWSEITAGVFFASTVISEALPFVKNEKANGILHAILNVLKTIKTK